MAFAHYNPDGCAPLPVITKRNPTIYDTGYTPSQSWVNITTGVIFELGNNYGGFANWEQVTNAGGGGYAPISLYIVDSNGTGDYLTVQAAINAAQPTGGTVYVRIAPTSYAENLTLYENVNVVGATGVGDGVRCIIEGTHIPPASGNLYIKDITFKSSTDVFFSAASGNCNIILSNCEFTITNGYICNLVNWAYPASISFNNCSSVTSTHNGIINNSGGAFLTGSNSFLGKGTSKVANISGTALISNCKIDCNLNFTGTGQLRAFINNEFNKTIITASGSSSSLTIYGSALRPVSFQAIEHLSSGTVELANCTIAASDNPYVINGGTGNLNLYSSTFVGDSGIDPALTTTWPAGSFFGEIEANGMRVFGDAGGAVGKTTITNVSSGVSSGAGSVKMNSTNSANSSGWAKIYVGTSAKYIPYWDTNTP